GGVVVDLAVTVAHDPAVAVVRVLAETDVGHQHEPGRGLADGAERARDDAVGIRRAARPRVLPFRNAEEEHGRHAEVRQTARFLGGAIDRELRDARHRRDGTLDGASRHDEERLHELVDADTRLANEPPERFTATETAWPIDGKAAHAPFRIEDRSGLCKTCRARSADRSGSEA